MLRTLTPWRIAAAAIGLTVLTAIGLTAAPASAHSKVVSTSPVDGSVLDAPPEEVSFTFDEALLPGTDTISINDDLGNVIASGAATVNGDTISMPWPAAATAGVFQVAYRVVSGDGHPVSGAIGVTIAGSGEATTPSTEPTSAAIAQVATEEPRGIAGSLVVIIAIGVLVLVVVAAVVLVRRRRRRRS